MTEKSNPQGSSLLAIFLGVSLFFLTPITPAAADSGPHQVALEVQALSNALVNLSRQTGAAIFAPSTLVKGISAPAVSGTMTVEEALRHLLSASNLTFEQKSDGSYTVLPTPSTWVENPDTVSKMEIVEEIITIGTRGKKRSVTDSPVPVDVISGDDFNGVAGTVDLADNLRAVVPSFTATSATADGSAFVRPTSLRGMAPDQVLVLVNGKRRHRSALVQFHAPAAGSGAHGADIGMLPGIAIKRVEVLRDGAAAQYGSDAIAGVINFVTNDEADGTELHAQWTQHYEGEQSYKVSGTTGFAFGNTGAINLSMELNDNEALSRGIQSADAQALIDAGVPGVGEDSPYDDAPLVQSWGRPEYRGARFFASVSMDVTDNTHAYAFANYSQTEGTYRFFYRPPTHDSVRALRDLGFTGLAQGYTPYLDGEQDDLGLVIGLEGATSTNLTYDFSVGYGQNELDYFLNNTLNQDLGLVGGQPAQMDFDTGGYKQEQLMLNADFSRSLGDNLNLAFGAEWREETYIAIEGEPNSYVGAGSSGMRGVTPQDAGAFESSNYGFYGDLEQDVTDSLLLHYALRYEDYQEFGDTLTGKLAGRLQINDSLSLRAAVATGFRAPTPGQANVKTTSTVFDSVSGQQAEEGLVRSTDPQALAVGGKPLKEEESFSLSTGLTAFLSANTYLTLDLYRIEVDDRIYRTGDIPSGDQTISFYTNALAVETSGVDLVVNSTVEWSDVVSSDLTFAFNYNEVDVVDQTLVGGIAPVSDSIIEDIENNFPNERFVLTANTHFGDKWNWMIRANFYGKHYDERGTISAAENPSAELGSTVYIDTEISFWINDNLTLSLGAVNLFDEYVDEIASPYANTLSAGLQYPRRSAANYEGGAWYLRAGYQF